MVWQAAEGLYADDVIDAAVEQLHHLAGQEPSLTGLIADGNNGLCIFYDLVDAGGRGKVLTLCIGLVNGPCKGLNGVNASGAKGSGLLTGAQLLGLINLVIEAIEHKAHKIRYGGLGAFCFQKVYQMVVGSGSIFYQDLTYHTYLRLSFLVNGDVVKVLDDFLAHLLYLQEIRCL